MAAEITTQHQFYYETDAPITAKALAETLMGLDGLVHRSAPIIARLLPGIGSVETEVLITQITLNSYKEDFLVRLIFGEGEAAEKKIEDLREKLKLSTMTPTKIVIGALMLAILYGGYLYVKPGDPAAVHIENSFNSLGSELKIPPADLRNLVEACLSGHKEDIKKQVVKLTHPDANTQGGTITFDGNPALTINPETIKAIPNEYEREEKVDPFKDFDNQRITVRATDLDRPDQGWAAIIPDIDPKRYPLSIGTDIKPEDVPSGKYFYGDIIVVYQVDKKGNKTPKKYLLLKLHGAKSAPVPSPVSTTPSATPSGTQAPASASSTLPASPPPLALPPSNPSP